MQEVIHHVQSNTASWSCACHDASCVTVMAVHSHNCDLLQHLRLLRCVSSSLRQQEPAARSTCCTLPYQVLHPPPQWLHQRLQRGSLYASLDILHRQQTGTVRPVLFAMAGAHCGYLMCTSHVTASQTNVTFSTLCVLADARRFFLSIKCWNQHEYKWNMTEVK